MDLLKYGTKINSTKEELICLNKDWNLNDSSQNYKQIYYIYN